MLKKLFLTTLITLLAASNAYAHASVEMSEPAADSVASAPQEISITFSEALLAKESSITLFDAAGKSIPVKHGSSTADNTMMVVTPPPLQPGTYNVKWKAVCLCTDHHMTQGSFHFSVK